MRADAVLRFVVDQVPAHVLHDVPVHAFFADAHMDRVVVIILFFLPVLGRLLDRRLLNFGIGFLGRQRMIVEVLVFRELAAIQLKQLLRRSLDRWSHAVVGNLLAHHFSAAAGDHLGMLHIDVMGALGFGPVLILPHTRHDPLRRRQSFRVQGLFRD